MKITRRVLGIGWSIGRDKSEKHKPLYFIYKSISYSLLYWVSEVLMGALFTTLMRFEKRISVTTVFSLACAYTTLH